MKDFTFRTVNNDSIQLATDQRHLLVIFYIAILPFAAFVLTELNIVVVRYTSVTMAHVLLFKRPLQLQIR